MKITMNPSWKHLIIFILYYNYYFSVHYSQSSYDFINLCFAFGNINQLCVKLALAEFSFAIFLKNI